MGDINRIMGACEPLDVAILFAPKEYPHAHNRSPPKTNGSKI